MSDFKGRHFEGTSVLWAVRWYCQYGISYRDLERFYNPRRRHLKLGYLSPMEFEARAMQAKLGVHETGSSSERGD